MGKLIQPKTNYTIVSNNILRDKTISMKAKGLYTIMRALPDNWNFSVIGLASLSSDMKEATQSAIWELEKAGYLSRQKLNDENGYFDWEYTLYHKAIVVPPMTENQSTVKPSKVNPSYYKELNNKQNYNKELNNNAPDEQVPEVKVPPVKPEKPPKKKPEYKSDLKEIAEVIKAMVSVDPKNKLYYGNTTQKGAVDFLIQEYSLQTVLSVIGGIPMARQTVKYFPSITTPCELRDKWVKAFEAIHREKQNQAPVIRTQSV
jgi:hypothetical protein